MKKLKDVPFEKIYVGMPVTYKHIIHYALVIDEVGSVAYIIKENGAGITWENRGVGIAWENKDGSKTSKIYRLPSISIHSYIHLSDFICLDPERM